MKLVVVFGSAAAGKSSLLGAIQVACSLGAVPNTKTLDAEIFYAGKESIVERVTQVLEWVTSERLVVCSGAQRPDMFVDFAKANKHELFLVTIESDSSSYRAMHAAKNALRGAGSDKNHVIEGAMAARGRISQWAVDYKGDYQSCLWRIMEFLNDKSIPATRGGSGSKTSSSAVAPLLTEKCLNPWCMGGAMNCRNPCEYTKETYEAYRRRYPSDLKPTWEEHCLKAGIVGPCSGSGKKGGRQS